MFQFLVNAHSDRLILKSYPNSPTPEILPAGRLSVLEYEYKKKK
ncbi:MAG: hypothetical protein O4861_12905 [Trichodesmium sp. St16_bin4-tuft]|nr:hypothetical protein [Trichodesmium sp. St5_bin8]MDE5079796.1 hypothetical protein [Trichodesmium sp. St2_bin6]MDE5099181.1 hypothetical protein [Trichodesmium sp. St16_bin4-tuft]